MKAILITGATGKVGRAVIKYLQLTESGFTVLAGVRNVKAIPPSLRESGVEPVHFDFEDRVSIKKALGRSDVLFLLRPPQLSNVKQYFEPVIKAAQEESIQHIVFLSVQGGEKNAFIPHNKIERLITDSSITYTFLRPAYFMQNFTTTLREDIVKKREIFLPAGTAKFTLVDLEDVGKVAAMVLTNKDQHANEAYPLTSQELLTFQQMASILSQELDEKVRFISPGLFRFYWAKRKEGTPTALILVMMMLHYLPRYQAPPPVTHCVEEITGSTPRSFRSFVQKNRASFREL